MTLLGGYPQNDENMEISKEVLSEDWDINNREESDAMTADLKDGLHNPLFIEDLKSAGIDQITEDEFNVILSEVGSAAFADGAAEDEVESPVQTWRLYFDAYSRYGENAIFVWDLGRVGGILGFGYLAGYYTYEEAMDELLEVAGMIQETYNSWDECWDSYIPGNVYWNGENMADPTTAVYSRMQSVKNKDYDGKKDSGGLPWDLELRKDW